MKRIYLSLCLLAALFLTANVSLSAQQQLNADHQITIIQKATNDDGSVTVKKKRFERGQSPEQYIKSLEMDGDKYRKMELTIVSDDNDEAGDAPTETIFFFRNGDDEQITIKGQGDWEHELHNMHFEGNHFQHHQQKENKALLGVYPETRDNGVLIESIVTGGGAEKAGLLSGDVMTAINGERILNNGDLRTELAKYQPGDVVVVDYLRDGQTFAKGLTLTERGKTLDRRDPCKVFIGVTLGGYGNGREGVGVAGVISGWPAEEAGILAGDRILALDGVTVGSHDELLVERNKHKAGDYFTISILRAGERLEVDAQFKECPQDEPVEEAPQAPAIETTPEPQAPIEIIDNQLELGEFTAYPNPTVGKLNVRFQAEPIPTVVTVTDINGKLVYQEEVENFDGYYSKELDVSSGTPGTLMLSVTQDGKVQTKPIILLNRA